MNWKYAGGTGKPNLLASDHGTDLNRSVLLSALYLPDRSFYNLHKGTHPIDIDYF